MTPLVGSAMEKARTAWCASHYHVDFNGIKLDGVGDEMVVRLAYIKST